MDNFIWSVFYILSAGLIGTGYVIYYILRTAYIEISEDDRNNIHVNP